MSLKALAHQGMFIIGKSLTLGTIYNSLQKLSSCKETEGGTHEWKEKILQWHITKTPSSNEPYRSIKLHTLIVIISFFRTMTLKILLKMLTMKYKVKNQYLEKIETQNVLSKIFLDRSPTCQYLKQADGTIKLHKTNTTDSNVFCVFSKFF